MRRVSFKISVESLSNSTAMYDNHGKYRGGRRGERPITSKGEIRRILEEMFDINLSGIQNYDEITIVCSAEAFVDWQIKRNELGCINTFRNLHVKWIECEPPKSSIFYSRR